MKRPEIKSIGDRNFLYLGIACIAFGILVYLLSVMFDFPGIIAFKGGLATGVFICIIYFGGRLISKR